MAHKSSKLLFSIVATGIAALSISSSAFAGSHGGHHDKSIWLDTGKSVVKNPYGLCWQSAYGQDGGAACGGMAKPAKPMAQKPAAAPKPKAAKVTLQADALFSLNNSRIRTEGQRKLDRLAGALNQINYQRVSIIGHADRIGSTGSNQRLSERRASSIANYLASRGVPSSRLSVSGRGETQPVTGNRCEKMGAESGSNRKLVACLQPDRRVEIEVTGYRR